MIVKYELNKELFQECINIASGLFYPLDGFMSSKDYYSVIDKMVLSNGEVWTLPVSLDLDKETYDRAIQTNRVDLYYGGKYVAILYINDYFIIDANKDVKKIFGTDDINHPGVAYELARSSFRVGGRIVIIDDSILNDSLSPRKTKNFFESKGWKSIAGFQTRNPIHKAHEYLQRIALDVCDGLFINPLVGWKKIGDFSEQAVIESYEIMIENYYFGLNVYFETLKTPMRYAGPREAIFHALIRRNLGCTHFIIGRDHAGVGSYYGKYEAHELAKKLAKRYDLGIELMLLSEPFYCRKCGQIVSEKTCGHKSEYSEKISGTLIRDLLANGEKPSELFMRPEISDCLIKMQDKKFILGKK